MQDLTCRELIAQRIAQLHDDYEDVLRRYIWYGRPVTDHIKESPMLTDAGLIRLFEHVISLCYRQR